MNALDLVRQAEAQACGCEGDYIAWCGVCGRSTCHAGEHSTSQLLSFLVNNGDARVDIRALSTAILFDKWNSNTWRVRG